MPPGAGPRTHRRFTVPLYLLVWGVLVLGHLAPVRIYEFVDFALLGARYQLDSLLHAPPETQDVVVLGIDDQSLATHADPWPWPRSTIAEIVRRCTEAEVAALGLDLFFPGAKASDPESDAALRDALQESSVVVLASSIGTERGERTLPLPHATFAEAAGQRVGAPAMYINPFGQVSLVGTRVSGRDQKLMGFGLEVLLAGNPVRGGSSGAKGIGPGEDFDEVAGLQFHRAPGGNLEFYVNSGSEVRRLSVELGREGSLEPNYRYLDAFPRIPVAELLAGRVPREQLRGKYVFLGITAHDQPDRFSAPGGHNVGGVELHALLVACLLDGAWMRPAEPAILVLVLLGLGFLQGLLGLFLRPRSQLALASVGILLWWLVATFAFSYAHTNVPLIRPTALFVLLAAAGLLRYRFRTLVEVTDEEILAGGPTLIGTLVSGGTRATLAPRRTEGATAAAAPTRAAPEPAAPTRAAPKPAAPTQAPPGTQAPPATPAGAPAGTPVPAPGTRAGPAPRTVAGPPRATPPPGGPAPLSTTPVPRPLATPVSVAPPPAAPTRARVLPQEHTARRGAVEVCSELLDRGDIDGAVGAVRAMSLSDFPLAGLFDLGCRFQDRARFEVAEILLQEVYARDPVFQDAEHRLETIREKLARFDEDDVARLLAQRVLHERFRNPELIGRGGMGFVFRVRDSRRGDEVLALKVLSPFLANEPLIRERFLRESRCLADLRHPNLIHIHDVFEANLPYYTMELLTGRSLHQELAREGPFPRERLLDLMIQACRGLEVAHQAGIVHRDLKPDNLMVDDAEHLKVLDFGIARFQEASRLTRTGQLLGTLQYMSPEQLAGTPVSPRSDQYSLALVVHELALDILPFPLSEAGLPAGPANLRELRVRFPEVAEVLEVALAEDPEERFPELTQFREALESLREDRLDP